LAERLKKLLVVKWASRHIVFGNGGSDGDDGSDGNHDVDYGSDGSHGGDDDRTSTVATD
jgi:hypothetical protein